MAASPDLPPPPFTEATTSPSSPTTALLSLNTTSSPTATTVRRRTFFTTAGALILLFSAAIAAAVAHLLLTTTTVNAAVSIARPLTKLRRPTVILISSDGFRFGYQHKSSTPTLHRLIAGGTEAETGLIPVFPTLTFPNHYSIVTGLYPPHHGIIANHFTDPTDGAVFSMASHEPRWWLGEPLWVTAARANLTAATYFWPGSEVSNPPWSCRPPFCRHYNGSVPFDDRVDSILELFDTDMEKVPSFMTLYFEDPDHQGHRVGSDDPEITAAVERVDAVLGRLVAGLEKRGVWEDVSVIVVGDHGMVGTCDRKVVYLEDLAPWVKVEKKWVESYSPVLGLRPAKGVEVARVVAGLREGLKKVENGEKVEVFLKEELPERLHYRESERIWPIVGMVAEGYKVEERRSGRKECGGDHGYDNAVFSMRSIFVGHGPRFVAGRKVESFENVEIYNLVTDILGIRGADNNGSDSFSRSVLLPIK